MESKVRRKIGRYQDALARYLDILGASGSYRERSQIQLSDLELQEYLAIMRAEVLLLPVDAFACEAFLEHEDGRRRGVLETLGIRRVPMLERYRRYCLGLKLAMEAHPGAHVKIKEMADELYYRKGAAAAKAARHAERDAARKGRAVPDPQVGERRDGGGPPPEDRPGGGEAGPPVRDPAGLGDPGPGAPGAD